MYELLYIVPSIHTEDELKNVTSKLEGVIKETGTEIVESKNIGKLKFAYPIKKQTAGFYILLTLNTEPENLKKLNRALQLEKDVLRFMLTKRQKDAKEVEIKEFVKVDPTAKKRETKKSSSSGAKQTKEKEKIKLEDIDKKLDTLLEKEIV